VSADPAGSPEANPKATPFPSVVRSSVVRTARNPRDILVIKPSSLGDVVHTLPAVSLVKKHWPEARIHWLINPEWAPLLEGNPSVQETVIFPRNEFRGRAGLAKIPAWARNLRQKNRADLVLDFQGLLRSALIARLCGGEIIGLSDTREGASLFYHRTAKVKGVSHAVDRYLSIAASLGIDTHIPLDWPLPEGTRPESFSPDPPFIVLHPFARGAGKSLTETEIRDFCASVSPIRVVIAGRSSEMLPAIEGAVNLTNFTTLPELIWLLRHAAFVVSVDSGPMHIAAAVKARLLSIHTWSDPQKVGPYLPDAWIWKDRTLYQKKDFGDPDKSHSMPTIADVGQFLVAVI